MRINKIRIADLEFLKDKADAAAYALRKDEKIEFYRSENDVFYYAKTGDDEAKKIGGKKELEIWLCARYSECVDYRNTYWVVKQKNYGADEPISIYFVDKEDAEEYVAENDYSSGPVPKKIWEYEAETRDVREVNIKRKLKKYGLNIKEASERFEIPYKTIQKWCNGERPCPRYILKMMIKILEYEK